jgi:hypothetical protein
MLHKFCFSLNMGCSRKNSRIVIKNLYSLLVNTCSHTLVDNLSKFYCHLVQFNVSTIDSPTLVETKFHFTPHLRENIYRHHRHSSCDPLAQIEKRLRYHCIRYKMHLMYLQRRRKGKTMGVISGLCWGPINLLSSDDPSTRESSVQSSVHNGTKMD